MTRYAIFAAIILATGYACVDLGRRGAEAVERMLVARVSDALEALGYDWARVEADGLKLALRGHAPDLFALELATESARATAPSARVVSYATATLAPPQHRDPVRVELLRDEQGITLTGQTASRRMRSRLNAALAAEAPDLTVRDLTGIQAAQPPRDWGPEVEVASFAAARLANAYVVMEPGRVAVDGQATDEADGERLMRALLQRGGEHVALDMRIDPPAQLIAPFGFSAYKDAGAGIRLERCGARNATERAAILDLLRRAGVEAAREPCPVGLGGPGGDWPAALKAGLDALARLPAGRIDIEYRDARLTGAPPTAPETFEKVRAALLAGLPDGYSGTTELRVDDVATLTGIGRERFWMHIARRGKRVTLAGQVPDEAVRTAILTYAQALFGSGAVDGAIDVVDAAPPTDWQTAAMRALEQLAAMEEGEVDMAAHGLVLQGLVERPESVRAIHEALVTSLPDHDVETRLRIDLPAALARLPLPPTRCTAELSRINGSGGVQFDTGSAVISVGSAGVLDELAAVLMRCSGSPVEIGGHTDSQGSADFNQRLSQARAEAVAAALRARGVPRERIVARGYGEEMPVASNDTEAGRARNRRIEFAAAG